jgi:hypothetical protein
MKDRVFVVCGGASLKDVPLGWLRNEDTIAVNYMGRYLPEPTYWLTADSGVIRKSVENDFWDMPQTTQKIVVIREDHPRHKKVQHYLARFDRQIKPTSFDGMICTSPAKFATGKNSGFCALQFAVHLGYKEIILLGVDLQRTNGQKYWYHAGSAGDSPFKQFLRHYIIGLKRLKDVGIKVISGSKVSRLNDYIDYIDPLELVPKMPVFVSHYTNDTPYQNIVAHLKESLDKHELDYDIEGIDTLGTWRWNSNYCAWQIRAMLDKHAPRGILRLDADARVQRYPDVFLAKRFRRPDVGACIWRQSKLRPDGELMGGTLYFGNTAVARAVVDSWIELLEKRPNARNSDMLHVILRKNEFGHRFFELPIAYCKIFDFIMVGAETPIIEHFQASRKCKAIVNRHGAEVRQRSERR